MADTDKLQNYVYVEQPTIDGNARKYLKSELTRLSQSISLIVTTMKQLETRMVAHGI